ncbi:MAG: PQQ-binding-like beta-propeller repeat protein [Planctomycetaceae bacterium]|nr:PQQ-binding-like beta-propeller repeat protein [Planctomycetaceae bacterium]
MSELSTNEMASSLAFQVALLVAQITVVASAGLLLSRGFRRDPATRHAVLLTTLAVLLLSPLSIVLFTSADWSLWSLPVAGMSEGEPEETLLRPVNVEASHSEPTESPSTKVAATAHVENDQRLQGSGLPVMFDEPHDLAAFGSSMPSSAAPVVAKPVSVIQRAMMIGLLVWGIGGAVMLLRMVYGCLRVRRLCRDAEPSDSVVLANAIGRVRQRYELQTGLNVLSSNDISTAFVTGLWQPVILVPRSYIDELCEDELFAVLSHEVAHLVRRDLFIGLMQRLTGVFYWPHPLVHVVNRSLSRAREEICDNFVLQQVDETAYSNVLLQLALPPKTRSLPAGTLAFLNQRWKLEDRITGLLDKRRQRATRSRRRPLIPIAAVLLSIATLFAGLRISAPTLAVAQGTNEATTTASDNEQLPGGADMRLGGHTLLHAGWHKNVGFSADSRVLVTSSERSMKFWNTATGQLNLTVDLTKFTSGLMRLTPDRQQVAVVGRDRSDPRKTFLAYEVRFWNMEGELTGERIECPTENGDANALAFTPDGRFVLIGEEHGYVSVWELASGELMLRYKVDLRDIKGLDVSPDGQLVAFTSASRKLFLWNWLSLAEPEVIGTGRHWEPVRFSPDGQQLAVGFVRDAEQAADVYEIASGHLYRALYDVPKGRVSGYELAFTPDGKRLAVANSIRRQQGFVAAVLLWDLESGELQRRFTVPGMHPRHVDISPDGRLIAAVDWDLNVRIWDIETGKEAVPSGEGHSDRVTSLMYSASSDKLLTSAVDHSARLWDAETGQELIRFEQDQGVQAPVLSQDGSLLATAAIDDTIIIWDAQTGKKRHVLHGKRPLGGAWELAFSPDQIELIALEDDLQLRRWSTETGDQVFSVQLRPSDLHPNDPSNPFSRRRDDPDDDSFHREELMMLLSGKEFTPDASRVLITAREDGAWSRKNRYWAFDAATGEELFRRETSFAPYVLAFSPDQQRIVFGSRAPRRQFTSDGKPLDTDKRVDLTVVEMDSGDLIWQKRFPADTCNPVRFSPDGRLVAAVLHEEGDSQVMFFDAATGSEVHTIEGTQPIAGSSSLAFSPDGRSLAVSQENATVLTWKLERLGPAFVRP